MEASYKWQAQLIPDVKRTSYLQQRLQLQFDLKEAIKPTQKVRDLEVILSNRLLIDASYPSHIEH